MVTKLLAIVLLTFATPFFQSAAFFGSNYATASGGGPPLANLVAAYEASSISPCSGAVGTWTSYPSNTHPAVSVGSPTCVPNSFGTQNGVHFVSASQQYFTLANAIPGQGAISIYAVYTPASIGPTNQTFVGNASTSTAVTYIISGSGLQALYTSVSNGTSTGSLSGGTCYNIAVTFDNGVSVPQFYLGGVPNGSGTGTTAATSDINFIGANHYSGAVQDTLNGNLAALLIYSTSTFNSAVYTYLNTKYGC